MNPCIFFNIRTGYYPSLSTTVEEVSLNFGRCYSVYYEKEMSVDSDYFTVDVGLQGGQDRLLVYVHEKWVVWE